MFKIMTLAAAATAAVHLKNLDGELLYADFDKKLPMRIHVHSPGSAAFAAVETRQTARALKRMQDNDNKLVAAPTEVRVAEQAEDLAALTISFENFEYEAEGRHGAELFQAFYATPELGYLTRQVTKFLADWGNFKPASASN